MRARYCEDGTRLRREVMRATVWNALAERERKALTDEAAHVGRWEQASIRVRAATAMHSEVKREYDSHRDACPACKTV